MGQSEELKANSEKNSEPSYEKTTQKFNAFVVPPEQNNQAKTTGHPHTYHPANLLYIYESHAIIHSLVNKVVKRVAASGYSYVDEDNEELDDEQVQQIEKFFSGTNNTTSLLVQMRDMVRDMLVVGDTYVERMKFNPRVQKLEVVSPKYMRKKTTETGEILKYIQYYNGRTLTSWEPDEMFSQGIGNGNVYSISPVHALMKETLTDLGQIVFNTKFFENDATPGVILKLSEDIMESVQDQEQAENLKQQLKDSYQGMMNSGTPVMSNLIEEVQVIERDLDKMQFIESRDKFIEKAAAAFDMSKVMLGITDSANEATASQTMRQEFYATAVRPYEQIVERFLNNEILPELGFRAKIKIHEQEFTDRKEKVNSTMQQRNDGLLTTNEAREILGLPLIEEEWADQYMIKTTTGLKPADAENPVNVDNTQKSMMQNLAKMFRR